MQRLVVSQETKETFWLVIMKMFENCKFPKFIASAVFYITL